MADLKALFAKAGNPNAVTDTGADNSAPEPESVSRAPETPAPAASSPANPFAARPSGGASDTVGQPEGVASASVGNGGSGGQPQPKLSDISLHSGTRNSAGDSSGVAIPAIDSLDALDSSEDAGTSRDSGSGVSYFADETPADKPTRELPEGLTKEQMGFIGTLDSVYEIIHDPDLLGGVIRNIMVELKSNPEYTKLIAPEDVRVMVRGMRESMGLARVKKTEAKAKRSGGSKKSKAVDIDMLADLDSIVGGID
jgi:hypothetical protein